MTNWLYETLVSFYKGYEKHQNLNFAFWGHILEDAVTIFRALIFYALKYVFIFKRILKQKPYYFFMKKCNIAIFIATIE